VYKNPKANNCTIIRSEENRLLNSFNIINNPYNDYNLLQNTDPIKKRPTDSYEENDYINNFNYSFCREVREDFEDDISIMNDLFPTSNVNNF
jgi:hypothetical protein